MTRISLLLAVLALAACAPEQPNDVVQGVGFDDPTALEARQARDAELAGNPIPDAQAIGDETAGNVTVPQSEAEEIAEEAVAAVATPRPGNARRCGSPECSRR